MEHTITLIVSCITALVAVLSPLITAIINNCHQYKMRNLELFYEHKVNAIQNYIAATGSVLDRSSTVNSATYAKSYGDIYLYTSPDIWPLIDKMDSELKSNYSGASDETFIEICKALSSELRAGNGKCKDKINQVDNNDIDRIGHG